MWLATVARRASAGVGGGDFLVRAVMEHKDTSCQIRNTVEDAKDR
jgi:hypothetical protein